jgi:homoserine O-succinyltransferase
MAAAWHFHRIPKYTLENKAFGVFRHRNNAPASPYLAGFSDDFAIPVSRWTEVRKTDIPSNSGLDLLMESDATGPCLLAGAEGNRLYMFNHIEYDSTSLKEEYDRDVAAGVTIEVPHGYYPEDNPARPPLNRWRSHAHLLFGNWINRVYQTTSYDLENVGKIPQTAGS